MINHISKSKSVLATIVFAASLFSYGRLAAEETPYFQYRLTLKNESTSKNVQIFTAFKDGCLVFNPSWYGNVVKGITLKPGESFTTTATAIEDDKKCLSEFTRLHSLSMDFFSQDLLRRDQGKINALAITIPPSRDLLVSLAPSSYSDRGGSPQTIRGSQGQGADGLKAFALGDGGTALNMEMKGDCKRWADGKGRTCELTFTLVDHKKEN